MGGRLFAHILDLWPASSCLQNLRKGVPIQPRLITYLRQHLEVADIHTF